MVSVPFFSKVCPAKRCTHHVTEPSNVPEITLVTVVNTYVTLVSHWLEDSSALVETNQFGSSAIRNVSVS